jgi:thiol-disulfide isomerase/thioredoxin
MKFNFIVGILCLCCNFLKANNINFYGKVIAEDIASINASVKISSLDNSTNPIIIDIAKDGSFSKSINVTKPILYQVSYGGYYILCLMCPTEKELQLNIIDKKNSKQLSIIGSKENDAYITFRDELFQCIDTISAIKQSSALSNEDKLNKLFKTVDKHNLFLNNLSKQYIGTYVANSLINKFTIDVTTKNNSFNNEVNNFLFKGIDFSDSMLYVTKDVEYVLTDFFDLLADTVNFNFNIVFDQIFKQTNNNEKAFLKIANLLLDKMTSGYKEFYLKKLVQYLLNKPHIINKDAATNYKLNLIAKTIAGNQYFNMQALDTSNKYISLQAVVQKNRLTLLIFWEPDCAHCKAEIPNVKSVYDKYKGAGFGVYAVNIGSDNDYWIKYITENNLNWVNVIKPDNLAIYQSYYLQSTPIFILINNKGEIVSRFFKPRSINNLVENYFK